MWLRGVDLRAWVHSGAIIEPGETWERPGWELAFDASIGAYC